MSGPFEQAWMLLKNAMDYGEIASELPEPNPLDAALARARNQGPAPGANLKRLPPPGTESIQDMDMMMRQRRGQTPLGKPVPRPPVRPELLASSNHPLTSRQFETPQTADKRMEEEDASRGFDEY